MKKNKKDIVDEIKTYSHEEFMEDMRREDEKKNLRNWIGNKIPNGIANYHPYHALTHPWLIVDYWISEIKYAWQRVFRGWDDTAVWSIDGYLAKLIPQLVRKLHDDNIGVPFSMFEGLGDGQWEYSEEDDEIARKRWIEVQNKIIEGFEAYLKLDFFPHTDNPEKEELKRKFEEGFDLFREHFPSLWD